MAGPQRPGDSTRRCSVAAGVHCRTYAHGPKNVHTARSRQRPKGRPGTGSHPSLDLGLPAS